MTSKYTTYNSQGNDASIIYDRMFDKIVKVKSSGYAVSTNVLNRLANQGNVYGLEGSMEVRFDVPIQELPETLEAKIYNTFGKVELLVWSGRLTKLGMLKYRE